MEYLIMIGAVTLAIIARFFLTYLEVRDYTKSLDSDQNYIKELDESGPAYVNHEEIRRSLDNNGRLNIWYDVHVVKDGKKLYPVFGHNGISSFDVGYRYDLVKCKTKEDLQKRINYVTKAYAEWSGELL